MHRVDERDDEIEQEEKLPAGNKSVSITLSFPTDVALLTGASDTARFGLFFRELLDRGIYIAPSQFEAAFVSAAHTDEDIAETRPASVGPIMHLTLSFVLRGYAAGQFRRR